MTQGYPNLNGPLALVRRDIARALRNTSLRTFVARFGSSMGGGKMLRARLILRVGLATGEPAPILCRAGAAVEMLHAASLLHDDVVDGGAWRRNAPALWATEGTRAAVLLGDLLVALATETVQRSLPDRLPLLISTLRDMCEAEAEQEFFDADTDRSWTRCVRIARRKTGSLFGFAAACAGESQPDSIRRLCEAGTALGTAYQLADDLLDACPDAPFAGKSLGNDAIANKLTAVTADEPEGTDARAVIASLLRESENRLAHWPVAQAAWRRYGQECMAPLIETYTGWNALEKSA